MTNRRNFLKLSALASLPLVSNQAFAKKLDFDETYDVVVVGSGFAGLWAAISANQEGAGKVVLFEKGPSSYLGASGICGGSANAAGTKGQKDAGYQDDKAVFEEEVMRGGNNENIRELVHLYCQNAADTLDWFYDKGMKFSFRKNPAFSVLRQHACPTGKGAELLRYLQKEITAQNIPLRLNTPATSLITDEQGKVIGVTVKSKGVEKKIRANKGVILCTGGFLGDPQLIDRFLTSFAGAISCGSPLCKGDGLLMATKIGAATTHLNYGAVFAYGMPTDAKNRRGLNFRGLNMALAGGIVVGPDGKRFIKDETLPTPLALEMARRGFKKVYSIGTVKQLMAYIDGPSPVTGMSREALKDSLKTEKYHIRTAPTLRELAEKIGVNPTTLEETVKTYNNYVENGVDLEFNRKSINGKIEDGPFAAMIGQPVALASIGGLRVNPKLQVLDAYLHPIPGLYAAGEIIGGLHGNSYIGGDSVGSCMTFGRLAGKSIAGKLS